MASYSAYSLENKNADKIAATKAGIISMINVYKKGISISKSKEMEKAIKALDQNKLDEYIAKNFG
jgi:predicted Fe-Mo cluster-binding NifX family protein